MIKSESEQFEVNAISLYVCELIYTFSVHKFQITQIQKKPFHRRDLNELVTKQKGKGKDIKAKTSLTK